MKSRGFATTTTGSEVDMLYNIYVDWSLVPQTAIVEMVGELLRKLEMNETTKQALRGLLNGNK